jgi:hypothetical protein
MATRLKKNTVAEAPNLMWGTDATQIPTVLDGKVWLFAVVDHWNAEGMGWHVAKIGNRYAAAQAVGMAIKTEFGAVAAGVARGLALRHDHGSPFMADHFQNQIKFWGMTPSFAFVSEPQTNGVAERFFRTFKEQVVYGRIYQTIDDVRAAVRVFFERYNLASIMFFTTNRSSSRLNLCDRQRVSVRFNPPFSREDIHEYHVLPAAQHHGGAARRLLVCLDPSYSAGHCGTEFYRTLLEDHGIVSRVPRSARRSSEGPGDARRAIHGI